MYIIKSEAGQLLRDELAKSPQKILASAFPEFVSMTPALSTPPTFPVGQEGLTAPPSDGSNLPSAPLAATSDS